MTSAALVDKKGGYVPPGTDKSIHDFISDSAIHSEFLTSAVQYVSQRAAERVATTEPTVEERWLSYVRSQPGPISIAVTQLWNHLRTDGVKPPNATPLETGGILLSWTYPDLYFDIEVASNGTYEWFYLNSSTNATDASPDGVAILSSDIPPRDMVDRLKSLFANAV